MSHLTEELLSLIPPRSPTACKLDKLSVLKMAVQYLRSLRGLTESHVGENSRPSFIQDKELSHLVLKVSGYPRNWMGHPVVDIREPTPHTLLHLDIEGHALHPQKIHILQKWTCPCVLKQSAWSMPASTRALKLPTLRDRSLLSGGAQLDVDVLCDNDDTAVAAFMNYLEAEGGLGDPGDLSDTQWTL